MSCFHCFPRLDIGYASVFSMAHMANAVYPAGTLIFLTDATKTFEKPRLRRRDFTFNCCKNTVKGPELFASQICFIKGFDMR